MESGKSLEKNISGANLDLVRTAKLVLDEYFSLTGEGAAGQQVKTFPEASGMSNITKISEFFKITLKILSRLRPQRRVRPPGWKVVKGRCSLSVQETRPPRSSRVRRPLSPPSPRYRGPAPSLRWTNLVKILLTFLQHFVSNCGAEICSFIIMKNWRWKFFQKSGSLIFGSGKRNSVFNKPSAASPGLAKSSSGKSFSKPEISYDRCRLLLWLIFMVVVWSSWLSPGWISWTCQHQNKPKRRRLLFCDNLRR